MIRVRGLGFFLVLWVLISFFIRIGVCEDDWSHVLTIEAPQPQNHGWFGYQVAISGDRIVVSEPKGSADGVETAGKVHVFDLEGGLIATVTSPNPGVNDQFGIRFDVSDSKIIVGALTTVNDLKWAGEASVFTLDGEFIKSIQSPEPVYAGWFAHYGGPAICEDLIAVPEIGAKTKPGMAGIVYLFDSEGVFLRNLTSPNPIVAGRFGNGLEIGEGFLLVPEYGQILATGPMGPGRVHVYDYSGNHLLTLEASEPEDKSCFGYDVAISGEKVVISARKAVVDDRYDAGRVFLFDILGNQLEVFESPFPSNASAPHFGNGVAIDGDIIVVGEPDNHVGSQYEGRAYVYDIEGNLLQNLTANPPTPRGAFGLDVDIEGDCIVVGECWAPSGELGQVGRVHVFKRGAVDVLDPVGDVASSQTERGEDDETGGGIPGYPVWSIVLSVLMIAFALSKR